MHVASNMQYVVFDHADVGVSGNAGISLLCSTSKCDQH